MLVGETVFRWRWEEFHVHASAKSSDGDWHRHQCALARQRALGPLAFGNLIRDQPGKFAIDLLLVGAVADAADEQIGTMTDEELIGLTPLHEFEVVGFHGWTAIKFEAIG